MGTPPKARSKTTARRIDVARRRARLLELRRAGLTFQEIVDQHPDLGYKRASNAAQDATRALRKVLEEPARDVLALELSRLDALTQALWTAARRGDVKAVDRIVRIMERRARLLGLDYADRNTDASDADEVRGMLGDLTDALGAHVAKLNAEPDEDDQEAQE